MMQWSWFVILGSCAFIRILQADETSHEPDENTGKQVEGCLQLHELDISVLGIDKIEDLSEKSFKNLMNLSENRRNCFIACVYTMKGIITPEGTLAQPVFRADPNKKFTTTFEDAIDACRGEKDFCRLGGCLYGVYSFNI